MTDEAFADEIYFEPLTAESLTAIIKKERPDGLLANLGGQTALNLAVELEETGIGLVINNFTLRHGLF